MCFTLGFLEGLIVDVIWIVAVIAIIRLLVPWLAGMIGLGAPLVAIVNIILWAVVAIWCVYLIFGLLSCLVGGGVGIFPHAIR